MPAATQEARVEFKVSILGEMQLHRALQGRIRATSDLSPAFERMADDFEEEQGKVFRSEGSGDGRTKWTPLSARYLVWKAKKFPGAKILYRTGALQTAVTGGAGSIREIKPLRLVVGGHVRVGSYDLGALHQTGTRKMPQRRVVMLGRRQRSRWMKFLTDHFRGEGRPGDEFVAVTNPPARGA